MDEKDLHWTRARLIPVSGITSDKEAETRASSAVLAVMSVVRDLSVALFGPMGASKASKAIVDTFTEPVFEFNGKKVRPDGLIRVTYGASEWVALVEVKTGDGRLDADQINTYWDIAREHGFDAIVTISNEIMGSPDSHPTDGLRVRSNSRVAVHHISWTRLLSTAVTIKTHKGVADAEQAWLIDELIRYLEHSSSGAMAFDDMGPYWIGVRDGARDDALRKSDDGVQDVASRWDQLLRFVSLQLGAQIGSDVQQVLPKSQTDQRVRISHLADSLASGVPLGGVLRVPNTIGTINVAADLKARRINVGVAVPAPTDRGGRGRCSWLIGQLKDAPQSLVIEAYPKNARTPHTATLEQAIDDRDLLLGGERDEPTRFQLTYTVEMGTGRKTGKRSPGFIDSVVAAIETFYGSVVQGITPWAPKAPKITAPPAVAASVKDDAVDSEPADRMPTMSAGTTEHRFLQPPVT